MCNAWNHLPNCDCGWGGFGLGRNNRSPQSSRSTLSHFTIPNATCRYCGSRVFYYQSVDGGRVFFDALGPPWPKHPCTASAPVYKTYKHPDAVAAETYQWQRDSWNPFILNAVESYSPNLLRVNGFCGGKNLELYIRKKDLVSTYDTREFIELSAIQVKVASVRRYQLSVLGPSLKPKEFFGYESSLDADNPLN
jgi:hypothetical protein